MDYQVTLFCTTNKYKPVSCIVKRTENVNIHDSATKRQLLNEGMRKICIQRGWNARDLATYGYATGKVRVYDKVKIEAEAAARYEAIKEAKYASGEWKRPKAKQTTTE